MTNHIPNKLNEIIGQDTSKILKWFENPGKKSLLIHGPTGVGKTSSVYALAREKNLEILELNSGDLRNKERIKNVIGEASLQHSLFGRKKLILIDEVDGISGRHDYGGLAELNKIIENTKNKIILTANEIFDSKFSMLRRKCELLEFKHVDYLDIFKLLKKICDGKKVKYNEIILKNIARKNNGDVRASLIDLNMNMIEDKINEVGDLREYAQDINEVLRIIFKSRDVDVLMKILSTLDEDLDEVFLWIDENLDKEYSEDDLINAYDKLSKADVYRGRILRRQYYRFLVYQSILMSAGVGLSKKEKRNLYISYQRPSRILKMWIANNRNAKRKSIAEKFAGKTHSSVNKAYKEFDILVNFLKDEKLAEELELDDDETEWIRRNF